ncbi:MAG: hypothetical protein IT210_03910 [Armatimonadetes bacterium]|nr:hypothetical protein [Armatimonadota bacterium]
MSPEATCCVVRQGEMVELASPSFAYRMNLSDGLKAHSWENRLTGKTLPLGGHPEIEVDLDVSDRRIFITGWRILPLSGDPCGPDRDEGFLRGFAAPAFNDSSWQGKPTPVSSGFERVALRRDYVWARTHLFLPPDTEGKPLTLVLGGVGLYDFRYMRVFVNGQEAGVRETDRRWNEPGAFDIGPESAVYPGLRFGQDNIIALQLSGLVTRTRRLDELDPQQNRSITARYYWPGQFEQYLVAGCPHVSSRFHIVNAETIREGESGEWAALLKSDHPPLSARVAYRWKAGEPLLRRFTEIQNGGSSDIRVMNVRLGRYETGASVSEGEQGLPVYIDSQFFASLAHPAGWATGQNEEVGLKHFPGKILHAGGKLACMEAVMGVAEEGAARKAFLEQMRGRMLRLRAGHNRPYAIFDSFASWPDGGFWTGTEEFLLKQIAEVVAPEKRAGCDYDFSTIELWRDRQGDIERPDPGRFPHGFGRIRDALDRLGIGLGLWTCTSLAGWSIDGNPAVGGNLTHDRAYGGDIEWFCMAADPVRTMFYTAFRDHIRKNGLSLIKLDGTSAICYNTTHDHWPGLYSTESIANAFIETLQKLHADNSALFIMLYWGLHSPWWLEYADTLFEPGLQIEAANPSASPALYVRDSVTVGLDEAQWWAEDIPPLGKDSLGVWLSDWPWNSGIGKERWQEGFVMDICRGSLLAQPWSDNGCLTDGERRQMADFIALLKERPDCFGNPRFIIGNPWKWEPYGYVCSSGERAFLAINNCAWSDRTFELKLDPSWGLPEKGRWDIYRWYPNPAQLTGKASFFEVTASMTLRPYTVALLEVVPAGTPPSLMRAFPQQEALSPLEEPSRAIETEVIASEEWLPVPMEENAGDAEREKLPPGRSTAIRCRIPAARKGGTLAVSAEMRQGEAAASLHNVGNCFSARARIEGRDISPEPIIPRWTFPAPWQGWRVRVGPSDRVREIEFLVSARMEADVRISWKSHFIPSDL